MSCIRSKGSVNFSHHQYFTWCRWRLFNLKIRVHLLTATVINWRWEFILLLMQPPNLESKIPFFRVSIIASVLWWDKKRCSRVGCPSIKQSLKRTDTSTYRQTPCHQSTLPHSFNAFSTFERISMTNNPEQGGQTVKLNTHNSATVPAQPYEWFCRGLTSTIPLHSQQLAVRSTKM